MTLGPDLTRRTITNSFTLDQLKTDMEKIVIVQFLFWDNDTPVSIGMMGLILSTRLPCSLV